MNLGRLPLATVWSWGAAQFFGFLVFQKLLRRRLQSPLLLPAEPGILRAARTRDVACIEEATIQLSGLGFSWTFDHKAATLGPVSGSARVLLSKDERTFAGLVAVGTSGATASLTSATLFSVTTTGLLVVTSSVAKRMPKLPGNDDVVQLPGGTPLFELYAAHLPRLRDRELRHLSPEAIEAVLVDLQARGIRHYLSLGLYEPATPEDIARATALAEALRP